MTGVPLPPQGRILGMHDYRMVERIVEGACRVQPKEGCARQELLPIMGAQRNAYHGGER
jgi:hypothetical protein